MVDFTTSCKTVNLDIGTITINSASVIRDTTLFDLQGEITSQLNIFPITVTGGSFGTGGTEGQTTLINLDVTMPGGSVATIKDWTINTVTFDQGATLIKNPTGKTMAGTFSMSAIAFNTPTLTSGSLFIFAQIDG